MYKDEDSLVGGKSGNVTVEFSEDVTSWTMEVTFDTESCQSYGNCPNYVRYVNAGTNLNCSGYTCTFDNDNDNGEQSAGNTIDITLIYDSLSAKITEVSITSESTPFCTS